MNKAEIRTLYLEKRKDISAAEKTKLEDLMLIQFQKLPIHIPSLLMSYAPIQKFNEFDPQSITDYCFFKNPNQVLFYPVLDMKLQKMYSVIVNDETEFESNNYGIVEPVNGTPMFSEEIDLVLVPMLAFDTKGYRVGYGKGYYDRFLVECRKDVVKIGFSFFDPIKRIQDTDKYDVRLDYCVTPHQVYTF